MNSYYGTDLISFKFLCLRALASYQISSCPKMFSEGIKIWAPNMEQRLENGRDKAWAFVCGTQISQKRRSSFFLLYWFCAFLVPRIWKKTSAKFYCKALVSSRSFWPRRSQWWAIRRIFEWKCQFKILSVKHTYKAYLQSKFTLDSWYLWKFFLWYLFKITTVYIRNKLKQLR